MNKTNLNKVRELSIALLYIPIEPVSEGMPFIVSHPFTNSSSYYNGKDWVDLFTKEGYDEWVKTVASVINNGKLLSIYTIVNKPYKLLWLKMVRKYLSDKDFAGLFADAWVCSENPNNDINVPVKELIKWYRKVNKLYLMEKEDYKVYSSVPDEFIVYRGVSHGRVKDGLSWTRNKEKAEWFRDRFLKFGVEKGVLLKAKVKKKDLLAYFNTRDEDEYVIDVSNIKYEVM